MRIVDLRSDTITVPTEEMRRAMYEARVGDDVYGEDPTVNELEETAARMVGKEAALFVTSGTMGNGVALMTHTQRGQEIILEEDTHIYNAEVGGLAALSGLQARPLKGRDGILDPADIRMSIREKDIHYPETGLICLENTHNMAGGIVTPVVRMREIYDLAQGFGIPVHLDGARVFNAAIFLGCDVKEITRYCDSVMFCLSKGLCAPVGSMLAGKKEFVERARRNRKLLGGGMRQVGVIAAAGLVALRTMIERLRTDHENAALLARSLDSTRGIRLEPDKVQTNMVMVSVDGNEGTNPAGRLVKKLEAAGILSGAISDRKIRFVTHRYVTGDDINYAVDVIKRVTDEA